MATRLLTVAVGVFFLSAPVSGASVEDFYIYIEVIDGVKSFVDSQGPGFVESSAK